ncbi:reverse transcriptase domain-containing protein, partial [Tanacetum coccineum]
MNGKLMSLNKFLSKVEEKSLPCFKTLRRCIKNSDFTWTEEAERAMKEIKKQIAELPTLTALIKGETLIMHLSMTEEATSVILLAKQGDKQIPMNFVGRALQSPEVNYPPMEKLVLALIHTARRLRRYFQAHSIVVSIDQPMKQVFSKQENSGRLVKWTIEL